MSENNQTNLKPESGVKDDGARPEVVGGWRKGKCVRNRRKTGRALARQLAAREIPPRAYLCLRGFGRATGVVMARGYDIFRGLGTEGHQCRNASLIHANWPS